MDKRLRWFDEGALMLRLVLERLGLGDELPAGEEYYACPCCLTGYSRGAVEAGILTEEHVPPEALGGHGMLLTCKHCNSNSGTHFDAHAVRRSDAIDFVRGTVNGRTMPVTVHADGIPLRGIAQRTEDGGIQIFGVPKQNDPKVQAEHFRALDNFVDTNNPNPNMSFTIRPRFDESRARLSWIRSAYLAAFAGLGWSYIDREVMDPIRAQLKDPNAQILPTYMFQTPTALTNERRILLVEEPDDLRCVAVVLGEQTVFLPGLWRTLSWDQLGQAFGQRRSSGDRLTVNLEGKEVPWPRWPTYLLDKPAVAA